MSETLIGFLGILALFVLLVARMPVGMALLVVGFGGIWVIDGQRVAVATMSSETYSSITSYSLSIIPLFVLMGNVAGAAGYSQPPLRGCLRLDRTIARRARFVDVHRVCRVRRGFRIFGGHRRNHRQGGASGDETFRICRRSGDRVRGRRRHARHSYPRPPQVLCFTRS